MSEPAHGVKKEDVKKEDVKKEVRRSIEDLKEEFRDEKNLGTTHVIRRLLTSQNVHSLCMGFDLGTGTLVMFISINGGPPIHVLSDISVLLLSREAIPIVAGSMALELYDRLQNDPKYAKYKEEVGPVLMRYGKMIIPRLDMDAVEANFNSNNAVDSGGSGLRAERFRPEDDDEARLMFNSDTFAAPIGDKYVTAVQFMMHVARLFLDMVVPPGMLHPSVIHMTMTLPAGFSIIQREAYMQMARSMGFEAANIHVVDEPSAGVVACIPEIVQAMGGTFTNVFVSMLDPGHGTTDSATALLSTTSLDGAVTVSMKYVSGNDQLGGATMDAEVMHNLMMSAGHQYEIDITTARRIKEAVLRDGDVFELPLDDEEPLVVDEEFINACIDECADNMVQVLKEMLQAQKDTLAAKMAEDDGKPGMAPNMHGLPHVVQLVGGTGCIAIVVDKVREMLEQLRAEFGLPDTHPLPHVVCVTDSQLRVAQGACLIAMSNASASSGAARWVFNPALPANIGPTYTDRITKKTHMAVIFAACQPVPSNPIRGMATRCWFVNNAMDGLKSYVYEGLSLDSMRRNKLLTVLQDRLEPIVPVDGLSVNFLLELSQGATGGEVLRSKLLYRVHDRWQPDAACTEVVSDERPGTEAELRDWTNKHLKSSQHAASHKTWSDRMTTRLGTLIDIPDAAEANKLVYVVDKGEVVISGAVTHGFDCLLRERDQQLRWAHLLVRAKAQGLGKDELAKDMFYVSAQMVYDGEQTGDPPPAKRRRVEDKVEQLDREDLEAEMQRALEAYSAHMRQDPVWIAGTADAIQAAVLAQEEKQKQPQA